MANRYETITELYHRIQKNVMAPSTWQAFLASACRNYRLSFDEQILVYAQRPDAYAVLEIERWNKRFGRWVNRGATGIAVFDKEHAGRQRLKFYFDISDTHESRFARPVPLWEVRPEFEQDIIEALENSFGMLTDKADLASALLSAAKNAVEDNMPDYLRELHYYTENTFLEGLDEYNVEVLYRNALQKSIGYMLLTRCGIDTTEYFSDEDFLEVSNFNTPETLNALGTATGDISQMCLSEISRTVMGLQRQAQKENRTFASVQKNEYPISEKAEIQPERSFEYERNHIHETGRLQPAEPSAPAGGRSSSWEIRLDAPGVSEGKLSYHLHEPADQRQAERSSDGDRADGTVPDGAVGNAAGTERGRDGGTQSPRSDEMGGLDEQHPAFSGGDYSGGAGLQLSSGTPEQSGTQQDQNQSKEENKEADSAELPAFLDEKSIMAIIANKDDDLKYNKQQIELFFSVHTDPQERADYLRSAYQDRYTEIIADDQRLGYKPQEDGLLMWEGAYPSRTKESVFAWDLVAGWTAQLIEKKEYFINTDIRWPKSQENQQMSLFDFTDFSEPASPKNEGAQISFFARPQLSQQLIDEALCIGSNEQNSRLIICAYLMKDKPLEENARFLREHYKENGVGFYFNDRQFSIWYGAEGIRISEGQTAKRPAATLLTWENAAKRIRELLELGRYMPKSELEQVDNFERSRLADTLLYLYRDIEEENQAVFPVLKAVYDKHSGFPDMTAEVTALLNESEQLQMLVDESRAFLAAYEKNRKILRFHYHRPKEILQRLTDLQREPVTFPAAEDYDPQRRFFISQDEVDRVLRSGGSDYRLQVYSCYRNQTDPKEFEKFLKNYHGEYSGSHSGNNNLTYTHQKLEFSHGSLSKPYAKIELSWKKAAKRIRELIVSDQFLSADDRAAIPQYEKHQLARNIQTFFSGVPQEQPRPFPYGFDFWDAVKLIEPQLDDPDKVEDIYQMMLTVWEATPQDDRYYEWRKERLENLTAYRQGTYTLFAEKKEPMPLVRPIKEPAKEEAAELYSRLAAEVLHFIGEFDGSRDNLGYGGTEAEALASLEDQLHNTGQRKKIVELLQSFLDHADPEEEIAADIALCMERLDDLPQELSSEQAQREEITGYLEAAGWTVSEDLVADGIKEYSAHGGNGNSQDIADFIENEFLSPEEEPDLSDITQDDQPEAQLLEQAKSWIDSFCEAEYGEAADYSDLEKVGLAYTTITDDEIPIQVYADLKNNRIERYLDDQFLDRRQYGDLEALIENELSDLDFGDLIDVSDEDLAVVPLTEDQVVQQEHRQDYRLLSRLRSDCEYFLGAGTRAEKHLWAGSVEGQIAKMRELYEVLPQKPEWLSEQDIDRYERRMRGEPVKGWRDEPAKKEYLVVEQPQNLPQQLEKPLIPPKRRRERVVFTTLYPEISKDERHDFHITDSKLGYGTPGEKFAANATAIRCLKQIEYEERLATPDEQITLSRYVGWGGLADCFDEQNSHYHELKSLLSEEEYAAARASSLTAFYTSPVIIRGIYDALSQMGFQEGNILEPSCGIGNFIGMLPESMAGSKAYGVEVDSISGRIAQQLYQNANISVNGFEKVQMPDSFFDIAVGNVPFGDFKVLDKKYDKNHWLIHDYFFGKTLDKVRPGGIVAFITSKGTMDKENSSVRKCLAQRANLIGAVRLPDNAFKSNAGTEVTSDILFLQKRDHMVDIEPDWVHLDTDENGIRMNRYFVQHPEMILGDMVMESTRFGMDSTCKAHEGKELSELLQGAIGNLHAEITEYEAEELDEEEDRSIPADPAVKNFSYAVADGKIYFRENSRMYPIEVSVTAENRIRGMIKLRECVRRLIEYQTEGFPDEDIQAEQTKLNSLYDTFTKKYGLINSRGNRLAFSEDSSYCLLCSLEVLDEENNLKRKADMFTRRTIRPHEPVTSVDTASEALAVSISEKARVDMEYMSALSGKTQEELETELTGVIYRDIQCAETAEEIPKAFVDLSRFSFVTADEYLSGHVRRKLRMAQALYEMLPTGENKEQVKRNVEALTAVQPVNLSAGEIGVRIGANWVPIDVYQQFMVELLTPNSYVRNRIKILRSEITGQWAITEKNADRANVKANTTYGTKRVSAYHILEQTLNQKDVRVFDYVEDENGNKKPVLNKKETAIAQDRQELIKQKFSEWIWKDIDRRERLCAIYNETFNSIRPREYDGRHIKFEGMSPEITLRPHQINAIAHILYGGNTLLAHEVGAGKTFEMVAAAMEMKRLGLCTKSLIVVPNHITEQWAAEWLQLYPAANILVATKKDFETQNRKKFCGRISTGDFDAIIIGHSQFEKIPMSAERQEAILQQQIDEIMFGIEEAKSAKAERYTIKQLERTRKSLEVKLEKLNDQSRKDDVVTFEQLGVDRIFIDESHYFKNLFLMTKMRNVGGIAQTEAQKSSDLFMKCRYLDEITGGRGVIFATGTPISNSMVELYTIQRYLQYSTLQEMGLVHFDDWASNFGETVTAIELSPEGSGYRAKTRFAKFYNLPELMAVFKQVADIQTADQLKLPVPKANYHTEVIRPSELQLEMVKGLAERAEAIRGGGVDPHVDNTANYQ